MFNLDKSSNYKNYINAIIMNTFKFNSILSIIYLGLILSAGSCSDDDKDENPYLKSLYKVDAAITDNELFTFELYSETETLYKGYNKVYFRALNSDNNPISTVEWRILPLTSLNVSCPVEQPVYHSTGLYSGAIIFTDTVEWRLQIDGLIENIDGIAEIDVKPVEPEYSQLETISWQSQVFIVSLVNPKVTVEGSNTLDVCLSRKISQIEYMPVEDFTLKATIYPTSDSSSNTQYNLAHSDLGHYNGQVSLNSSGSWLAKILIISGSDTLSDQPEFILNIP
jgi:hypothetical protein